MIIAVDFDGTCVTHEFPEVGKEIGAAKVLKKLTNAGHKLILNTMRSDSKEVVSDDPAIHSEPGEYLKAAESWFQKNNIPLYAVHTNPSQHNWTSSPKCYAELYIDDAALGCPLTYNTAKCARPYVNWVKVEQYLYEQKIL